MGCRGKNKNNQPFSRYHQNKANKVTKAFNDTIAVLFSVVDALPVV